LKERGGAVVDDAAEVGAPWRDAGTGRAAWGPGTRRGGRGGGVGRARRLVAFRRS